MEGIFQPTHLLFLIVIALILGSIFILSTHQIESKIPRKQTISPTAARWAKAAAAVLLGNALYFYLLPSLPPRAQHKPMELDLGVLVDFWFCLFMYGVIEAGVQLSRWLRSRE